MHLAYERARYYGEIVSSIFDRFRNRTKALKSDVFLAESEKDKRVVAENPQETEPRGDSISESASPNVANAPLPDSLAAAQARDIDDDSDDGEKKPESVQTDSEVFSELSDTVGEEVSATSENFFVEGTGKTSAELVAEEYEKWHSELEANCDKDTQSDDTYGVIDLSHPHPTGGAQLFSGMSTRLTSLIREERAQRKALQRMEELFAKLDEARSTYGYAPVTLTTGQLLWSELPPEVHESIKFGKAYTDTIDFGDVLAQGDELPPLPEPPSDDANEISSAGEQREVERTDAPAQSEQQIIERSEAAIFQSARIVATGDGDAHITLTSRCEINPAVIEALRLHNVPNERIAQLQDLAANPEAGDETIARIRELGRKYLPNFSYRVSSLLGTFAKPRASLLADLEAMKPYMESSGIMAALAGDEERRALAASPLPPANCEDRSPETERGAGDLDVVELSAVEAVASGRSIAIDAPAGSHATPTLVSIAADAAATGRFVLYIPTQQTSRGAFIEEMERLGLGELILDLSDFDNAAYRVRTGMRLHEPELNDTETLELRDKLAEKRARLAGYVSALHKKNEEWDESVHTLLQHMAALVVSDNAPASRVRLPIDVTRNLVEKYDEISGNIREAARLGMFHTGEDATLWANSPIASEEAGQVALDRAKRLAQENIPVVMAQSHRVAAETDLRRAETFNEWLEQITMLDGIQGTLDVFLPSIYERSAQDMVIATATKEWREEHDEPMSYAERRRLAKQAREYLKPGLDVADLHDALVKVQNLRDIWRHYSTEGGVAKIPQGLSQIKLSAAEAVREIKALSADLASDIKLEQMPMEEMLDTVRRLADDGGAMTTIPRRNELMGLFTEQGLRPLIDDFAERGVGEDMIDSELDLIYCSSVFEQLVGDSAELSSIGCAELSQLADDVRTLDKAHTESLSGPVLRAVIRNMRETISRKRKDTMALDEHLKNYDMGMLAQAFAKYPQIVQASRPVWVVPSVLVAELIPQLPWADLVLMDALDTVSVAPVASMLMRGRQIAVMGDRQRAGEDSAIAAFSEILPVIQLPLHRARYDALGAATLREHGYGDIIEMIPSAGKSDSSRLLVVDGRGVPSPTTGMVEGTAEEVDAVVDAVVEHILTKPEKSLAVVSISPYHAERVREALRQTVRGSSVLQRHLNTQTHEPFVIVDITNCVGLRRDCVIVTVGLGKTAHGRVLHTFGALSEAKGLSGLIDTTQAPREELTVISSLAPGDIKPDAVNAPGPKLLARLLERMGQNVEDIIPVAHDDEVSPLVADLASRIEQAGWQTQVNFGYDDGVRIPLVAGSEDLEGTWRVAVLLDDEDYVNEPSLRRRDRYWLERFEQRGWIVYRTFSTSLFIDPVGQARAVIDLLKTVTDDIGETAPSSQLAEGWQETLREEASQIKERGARPNIAPGLPLAAYADNELDEMVTWIASDGRRRTEDELVLALREELDVTRRGSQIDAVLRNVVRRSGLSSDDISSALSAQSAAPAVSLRDEVLDIRAENDTQGKGMLDEPDSSAVYGDE